MRTKTNPVIDYNYLFLFVCIIWVPIQRYYLHIDGAGRTVMLLSAIAALLNISTFIKRKDLFHNAPFICWTLLVLFSFINSIVKGYVVEGGHIQFFGVEYFTPYVFLVTCIITFDYDNTRCLNVLLLAQLVYVIVGAMHLSTVDSDRIAAEELGNALPLMASGCTFVAGVLFLNHQLKGGWITYSIIIALALSIIIMTATRKALGAVVLGVMGVVLDYSGRSSKNRVFLLIIFSLILFGGISYILDNTLIGERIATSSDTAEVVLSKNPKVNNVLSTALGDRALQYYLAINILPKNPLTGIGLNNFTVVTQTPYRLHSEYMVQLCENGIIGFCLLIFFYYQLLRGIIKKRMKGESSLVWLFGLLMVLFLNLTSWTYNMLFIMIIYALLISNVSSYLKS